MARTKTWIVTFFSTRTLERLDENIGAVDVRLTETDLHRIEAAKIEIGGNRYPGEHTKLVGLQFSSKDGSPHYRGRCRPTASDGTGKKVRNAMNNETASPLRIRGAKPSDMEMLGLFGTELMALHHRWDANRFIGTAGSTPDLYSRYLTGQLARPEVIILIAEQNETTIGYVYARMEGQDYMALRGPAGVIHDIFVDAAWRQRGIGRQLLDATITDFVGRGIRQIVLSTAYKNEAGRGLFAKAGLRQTMVEMTLDIGEN